MGYTPWGMISSTVLAPREYISINMENPKDVCEVSDEFPYPVDGQNLACISRRGT